MIPENWAETPPPPHFCLFVMDWARVTQVEYPMSPYYKSILWGHWVFYLCDASPIHDKKAEMGGGRFSAQFSGIIILNLKVYLGDQLCSKYTKKSFVRYSVNEIKAYKDNILMTLQSSVASKVTVIAGILVCIMVGLPIDLPYAP